MNDVDKMGVGSLREKIHTVDDTHAKERLTSDRTLTVNTIWNIGGNIAALVIALGSVPIILRYLGTERLGVISLVWVIEGQFGIFDLGLSHALTKMVAERIGRPAHSENPSIFWSAVLILSAVGCVGAVGLWLSAGWIISNMLQVPGGLVSETSSALKWVAASLPVVLSSAALRGTLAAYQRFDLLNLVRVPVSLVSYLAPLAVLPFTRELGPFVSVLVLSRVAAWIVHALLCFKVEPQLRRVSCKGAPFRQLFSFGGWMSITNVVGPIMVNMDRMLIGGIISMAAVAYYSASYELATKMWIVSSSLTAVLFPALASAVARDVHESIRIYRKAVKYVYLAVFPLTVLVLTIGPSVLKLWLGMEFAANATLPLQILAVGVLLNTIAQMPFWQIQALGRPDLPAKAHLLELPCYLGALWWLCETYGIVGAALAWTVRCAADAAMMFSFSVTLLPEGRLVRRHALWMSVSILPALLGALLISTQWVLVAFGCAVLVSFLCIVWFRILTNGERMMVLNPAALIAARRQAA